MDEATRPQLCQYSDFGTREAQGQREGQFLVQLLGIFSRDSNSLLKTRGDFCIVISFIDGMTTAFAADRS